MKPSERMDCLENARSSATLERDYKKALREVAKVLRVNSHDPDALILRGNILDLDRKFSASRQCYMKVYRRCKTNVRALIDLGDWYARCEDITKALSFYDRALGVLKKGVSYISRSEEFEEAHQSKVLLLRDAGMLDEARQAIKEAKIDCPGFKPPRLRGNKRESKGTIMERKVGSESTFQEEGRVSTDQSGDHGPHRGAGGDRIPFNCVTARRQSTFNPVRQVMMWEE